MDLTKDEMALGRKSALASYEKVIHEAAIKKEQAKQQEIITLEKKKDLAPIDLVKYFFSFSEKIIQRIYRKPHDIEPQLAALFLAGENKKATQLIVRELESIVMDVSKELISSVKDEGFKIDDNVGKLPGI